MPYPVADDPADGIRAAHHQIGNSLQSVAGLLRLQGRIAEPAAAGVLFEASRRVGVITRLHQRLQGSATSQVCLADLLGDVCRDVAELDALDRDAQVRVDIEPVSVNPVTASAVAMITAELLSNALEHGLREGAGVIEVSLTVGDQHSARLQVSDNGPGPPGGTFIDGFGLSMIMRLAGQIGAAVERHSDPGGTRFDIRIPTP